MSKLISYNVDADNYSIVNDVFDTIELQKNYQNNTPFPHVVISSAIDQAILNDIAEEVNNFQPKVQKKFFGSIKKLGHDNLSMFKNLLKYRHESKKQVCNSFTYFRGQI